MFITFEGIEGSGKSTQIKLLAKRLQQQGLDVVVTREPGGTEIGDQIRKILLDSKNSSMVHACEVLLYYAARAQHLQELIQPHLNKGYIVLCDRFVDATMAYQGYARGVSFEILKNLNDYVLQDFRSDLTLIFDMPVSIGLARAKSRENLQQADKREDRFENELTAFHEKVRSGYLDLAKADPERLLIVDASLNIESLSERVYQIVNDKLQARK